MKVFVVLAHPQKGSFNYGIADMVNNTLKVNGHHVFFHDLYEEKFDPVLPLREIPRNAEVDPVVQRHCEELADADGIVVIHPNWWGQPPAVLKGWVDRVIRPGVAYEFLEGDNGEGVPLGLLKAKTALVFNTSNTPKDRELKVFGDPLQLLWKNCIFDFCGVENFSRKMYGVMVTSSPQQRREWLDDVKNIVNHYFDRT